MGLAQRKLYLSRECKGGSVQNEQQFWCAIQVVPNHEGTTAEHLAVKRLEYFLPMYRTKRRWSDRVKDLTLPFFPGYLFCRYEDSRRTEILSTFGVVRILGYGRTAAPVRDEEIEALRRAAQAGLNCQTAPYTVTGATARIQAGALKGLTGIIIGENRKKQHFIISVSLLQRSIAVELDAECLGPLESGLGSSIVPYTQIGVIENKMPVIPTLGCGD